MLLENDPVNAFVAYPPAEVPSAAAGPLKGFTFAVKDIYDVAGYPTGCGNPIKRSESAEATETASVVARLLDAGARFVGKTHTDELAFSLAGQNRHYGAPVNARASGRITGGSSAGSAAAVAAGLCDFAVGSDTGGSVRGPASFCGLYGIRPTHGRVALDRTMPLAPSFDVPGYFADAPDVFARVAPVFLGEDAAGFEPRRLLRAEDAFAALASQREAAALAPAEERIRARLGPAERVAVAPEGLAEWYEVFRVIQAAEAWEAHGAWIADRDPEMTPGVRERFEFGSTVTPGQLAEARSRRDSIRRRLEELLGEDAVLMLPTMPMIAPLQDASPAEMQDFRERSLQILCIAGLAGMPQVTMPLASLDLCPLGLSLIAPRGADRALVELAVAVAAPVQPSG
jgi:amidase